MTLPATVRKHLFIDDHLIAEKRNVKRVVNRPRLAGPVLEPGPEGSYNDAYGGGFGQIIEVDGVYRMWTNGRSARILSKDFGEGDAMLFPYGYYTSGDGIHWDAPSLGLCEWNGSRNNNIVNMDWGYVFRDPKPGNPEEQYKFLGFARQARGVKNVRDSLDVEKGGLYFHTSPDGIHWKWNPRRVLSLHPDCCNQLIYDIRLNRHVAYLRCWPHHFMRGKAYGRAVARLELDDIMAPWPAPEIENPCKPWGPDKIADPSTEYPVVMTYPGYDEEGHWTDIYDPNVIQYPWADDVYLAFPEMNHFLPESDIPNHSRLEIGMCVSRDGVQWEWPSLDAYIPFGKEGGDRTGMLYNITGMIRSGDEIFQYHFGTDIEHHGFLKKAYGYKRLLNSGRVYRTVQRLDGFVSTDFPSEWGEVITQPFLFAGEELRLNVNAGKGDGRVEVRDEQGAPLPDFAFEACEPISADATEHDVKWRGRPSLAALHGKPVRLGFKMRGAKLYAFQLA